MRQFLSAICIAVLFAQPSAKGHIHTEPDGSTVSWYPHECCHDGDCRPVVSVQNAANGLWMRTVDGQTVLIGPSDPRRSSKDMRWHICIAPDDTGTPKIRCVFEPPST
jgi:hypothetical protein